MDDATTIESVLSGAADPEIAALEEQLRAAQLNADVVALDRLIAEISFSRAQMVSSERRHRISMLTRRG